MGVKGCKAGRALGAAVLACLPWTALAGDEAPAAKPAAAPEGGLRTADEGYELKIKTLEERVNELKERIFRSKQRLTQLQEAVVGGAASTAKAKIIHRSEMGSTFRLKELHYFLDGAPLRQEIDEAGSALSDKADLQLFDGAILPGNHQITVNMVFQGSGYNLFSYVEGYTFKVRSSHTFNIEEGRDITIKVVAYEQGNVTTQMRDKPTIRYDVEIKGIQKVPASREPAGNPASARGAP